MGLPAREVEGQTAKVIDNLCLIPNPLPLTEGSHVRYYKGESRSGPADGCIGMNAALVCSVTSLGSTGCISRLAYDLASGMLKLLH